MRPLPAGHKRLVLRKLCRTDLFFLLRFGLSRPDVERQWLHDRCIEVQLEPNGMLDLWSREHYKSTVITFAKSIQDILASHGDDPIVSREVTLGIFSHTRPNAKGFLRQIKYEFEANEFLRELFPDVLWSNPQRESPKWSEDEGIIVRRKGNPKEATVEAWGLVDGQPTGKHFVGLVYDDIVTLASVTTPDMIAKTTEALEFSYNLGSDGGFRRFIGTRYHFNDSYRTLIDRGTVQPRIRLATSDGTMDSELALWSKDKLTEKRRDMGAYTFACQIMQNPVADETQGFKREWLRYHDGFSRVGLNVYLLFDPANGKRQHNDYTAAWAVGLGPDGNYYVLDMVRDRLNLTQRAALVMAWHRKWKPVRQDGVRYERYGLMADIDHILSVQREQNYRFDITEVAGQAPKPDRIKRLIPLFEQGKILLPRSHFYTDREGKTQDLVQVFIEQEYAAFPVPVHDDMLDGLARISEPDLPLIWPEIVDYLPQDLEPTAYVDG